MMKKFTFHFHQVLTALLTIAAFAVGQSAWASVPHAHSGSTTHTSLSVAPDDECTHEYEWIENYFWDESATEFYDYLVVYTCSNCLEVVGTDEQPATVELAETPATCETDGFITYTATCPEANSNLETKTWTEPGEPAHGHDFGYLNPDDLTWTWDEDENTYVVSASYDCLNGCGKTITPTADASETGKEAPTCVFPGSIKYMVQFSNVTHTDFFEKTFDIPQLEHEFVVTYEWDAPDTYWYTVHTVCNKGCGTDEYDFREAVINYETKDATCTEDGYTDYIAYAPEGSGLDNNIWREPGESSHGHDFGSLSDDDLTWTWDADKNTYVVTATIQCTYNCGVTLNPSADADLVESTPATCNYGGYSEYSVYLSYDNNFYQTNKQFVDSPPVGHILGTPTYSWVGEQGGVYQMVAQCDRCGDTVTKDLDATVNRVQTPVTCTTDGYTTCTAIAPEGTGLQDRSWIEDEIPSIGHIWGDWAPAPSCEESVDQTRKCVNCPETQTQTIAPLGHDWGEPTWAWTWADGVPTVTATFTCARDHSHTDVRNATVEQEEGGCLWTATLSTGASNESMPPVIVTIVGASNTAYFDGDSHSVSDFTATADCECYNVETDFTFSGEAFAAQTEIGTTYMRLTPEMFENTNPAFTDVTFVVTDGYQTIIPKAFTVFIVGNHLDGVTYDGFVHTVTGYEVFVDFGLGLDKPEVGEMVRRLKEEFIVDEEPYYGDPAGEFYVYGRDFTGPTQEQAIIQSKDRGVSKMKLTADMFTNLNTEYEVTFEIVDGYIEIVERGVELTEAGVTEENDVITDVIDHNNGIADVTLAGRTLYKDGSWNTICLPFDVDIESSPLAGGDARELNDATFVDGTLSLNFTDEGVVKTLKAGVPYIIKWADGEDLTDVVFEDAKFSAELQDKTFDLGDGKSVTFKGTYSKVEFAEDNKNVLLVGAENSLYYPQAGAYLNAQRAYFQLEGIYAGEKSAEAAPAFVLTFGDATVINGISVEKSSNEYFDLSGRRVAEPTTGIYIVNGKKVIVK